MADSFIDGLNRRARRNIPQVKKEEEEDPFITQLNAKARKNLSLPDVSKEALRIPTREERSKMGFFEGLAKTPIIPPFPGTDFYPVEITPEDFGVGLKHSVAPLEELGMGLGQLAQSIVDTYFQPAGSERQTALARGIEKLFVETPDKVPGFIAEIQKDPNTFIRKRIRQDLPGTVIDAAVGTSVARRYLPAAAAGELIPPVVAEGPGIVKRAAKAVKDVGVSGLEGFSGFMTRRGKPMFENITRMAKEGGAEFDQFMRTRKLKGVKRDAGIAGLAEEAKTGVNVALGDVGMEYGKALDAIAEKYKGVDLGLDAFKAELPEILRPFGVTIKEGKIIEATGLQEAATVAFSETSGIALQRAKLQKAVAEVTRRTSGDFASMRGLYEYLDDLTTFKLMGNTKVDKAITNMRNGVRERLRTLPEYVKANATFGEDSGILKQIVKSLSIGAESNETIVGKLVNIYRVLDRADYRRSMVTALDDITGIPFSAQLAGYATNRVFPTWTAVMQSAGTLGLPAVTAANLVSQPWLGVGFLALMPLASPRAMSRLVITLAKAGGEGGKAAALGKEVGAFSSALHKAAKAKGIATEGLPVLTVMMRVLGIEPPEEEEKEEDLLKTLGSIPAPTTLTVP
tara:strand:- start:36 stop:1919 length:1884 start_codon:yes stop_codon:yes gene_type:complete